MKNKKNPYARQEISNRKKYFYFFNCLLDGKQFTLKMALRVNVFPSSYTFIQKIRRILQPYIIIFQFEALQNTLKTIDFSNDFSFDFDPNFDPNFSTLNRFETVQNSIFSLHQTAKNPGNQGFPGFFKYGPEGNRTYVLSPETPIFPCFLGYFFNLDHNLTTQLTNIYPIHSFGFFFLDYVDVFVVSYSNI